MKSAHVNLLITFVVAFGVGAGMYWLYTRSKTEQMAAAAPAAKTT